MIRRGLMRGLHHWLHSPRDPSSLAIFRILFGGVMLCDALGERGLLRARELWAPNKCRFPLFNGLAPPTYPWSAYALYTLILLGGFGVAIGLRYRLSCCMLAAAHWYLLAVDKTTWNNHSYMFSLLTTIMTTTGANNIWSVDAHLTESKVNKRVAVPMWNYALLRFQMFALYLFAGLKKVDADWLSGQSMRSLNHHWVFTPFRVVLTGDQIDYWIVHVVGFTLDMSAGFLLLHGRTRTIAFLLLAIFHFFNSQLFTIGMFPYMCLVAMPLFCSPDWPRKLFCILHRPTSSSSSSSSNNTMNNEVATTSGVSNEARNISHSEPRKMVVTILLVLYVCLQCFLPYSHFITKGYNNWTEGVYGYSWDMMVHSWERGRVALKLVDHTAGTQQYIDHTTLARGERWSTHADMLVQMAGCVKERYISGGGQVQGEHNVSLYADVWCSLNGRPMQRVFDPRVDLLTAPWSPFQQVEWLVPLLQDDVRPRMAEIQRHVWSWNDRTDLTFIADLPGMTFENYVNRELSNVTLTVVQGKVMVTSAEGVGEGEEEEEEGVLVESGGSTPVSSGRFHSVHTLAPQTALYHYTYHFAS